MPMRPLFKSCFSGVGANLEVRDAAAQLESNNNNNLPNISNNSKNVSVTIRNGDNKYY